MHLFDPVHFPFAEDRSYTPGAAGIDELLLAMEEGAIDRAVLVQPSVYGNDNRCLLAALDVLGDRARGVAVADAAALRRDSEIAEMQARGVRGFRVNLVSGGAALGGSEALSAMASALAGSGMFLQIYAPIDTVLAHLDTITRAEVPVVLDHFAGIGAEADEGQLTDLMRRTASGQVWIKMSADYKLAADRERARVRAMSLIKSCVALRPDHVIWGSDWPHTGGGGARGSRPFGEIEPFRNADSHAIPGLFPACGLGEPEIRKIMCDNPARLLDPV